MLYLMSLNLTNKEEVTKQRIYKSICRHIFTCGCEFCVQSSETAQHKSKAHREEWDYKLSIKKRTKK